VLVTSASALSRRSVCGLPKVDIGRAADGYYGTVRTGKLGALG
jgi:hypothetical protein